MEILSRIMVFIIPLIFFAYLLSKYIEKIYRGEKNRFIKFIKPVEKKIEKILPITQKQMSAKEYFVSILWISFLSIIIFLIVLGIQNGIKQGDNLSFSQILNIAVSFVTNTNWQNYVGQEALTPVTQMLLLTVQNFLSAAVGIAVAFAVVRGIMARENKKLGNLYQDGIRIILYLLLPISLATSGILVASGVVQTFQSSATIETMEKGEKQEIILGPVASQIAIKQLGSNGGGYYGANGASKLENPNAFTNYIECFSILLIPMAMVFFFGRAVKEKKQGYMIFIVMLIYLILSVTTVAFLEENNSLSEKEARIGGTLSGIWTGFTTSSSNGSVNSLQEANHPISTAISLFLMGTGEIVFGGVGSGLYTILGYILVSVFIAGLMIGKSPIYLRKKIEPYEMKMAMILILTTPICILITTSILTMVPNLFQYVSGEGPHTLSQILYAATSTGANNGSNLTGFQSNFLISNIVLAINMLVARFLPIYAALKIGESLAGKKIVATNSGSLDTSNFVFGLLVVLVILFIGALSFLPAISLGPIAEAFRK